VSSRYDDEQMRAQARYLAKIGPDAEVFALLGHGYPRSIYKAFVRRTTRSKWHVFDSGPGRATMIDPVKAHAGLVARAGRGAVRAVSVPLSELGRFTHHPDRASLRALLEIAKEWAT
jgi:hypothetical protein